MDVNKIHKNQKVHECQVCLKRFYSATMLNKHIANHDATKTFKCDLCEKTYFTDTGLRVHKNSEHNKVKLGCDLCGKYFTAKSHLTFHVDTEHKKINKYQCVFCEEAFKTNRQLKSHFILEHARAYFTCHICKKQFYGKHPHFFLQRHIKSIHGGDKREKSVNSNHKITSNVSK